MKQVLIDDKPDTWLGMEPLAKSSEFSLIACASRPASSARCEVSEFQSSKLNPYPSSQKISGR